MTNDVHATVPPLTIDVVFNVTSWPLVPTPMSITYVPPDVVMRAHVAVPVAFADESDVIVLAVSTPANAAGANVADNANSANNVVAVPPLAGLVPS
jgi:hypothetical protein